MAAFSEHTFVTRLKWLLGQRVLWMGLGLWLLLGVGIILLAGPMLPLKMVEEHTM